MVGKARKPKHSLLSGIEYHGLRGITQECMEAIMRLIQFNDKIINVRILTWSNEHGLILTINAGDLVAIKSGFASGYGGGGPTGFSYILQLLESHGVEIDEYKVRRDFIHRLNNSCLLQKDIKWLDQAKPVRPSNWHDYILRKHWDDDNQSKIWREFPFVIPFAIINKRIVDLALSFWDSPDEKLLVGYRRLEDIVRKRSALDEHGSKLFSRTFLGSDAKLIWKDITNTEQVGRAGFFISAYQAFRNPRAHKELKYDSRSVLSEFLILNYLFNLENEAVENGEKTEQ